MKKIFTYMAVVAVAVLTACSDSDIAQSSASSSIEDQYAVTGTIANTIKFDAGYGDEDNSRITSKSLYYDRINGEMESNWTVGDKIGIFAKTDVEENKKDQFVFKCSQEAIAQTATSVTGEFVTNDGSVSPIIAETQYLSYSPYIPQNLENGNFSYNAVPITFKGQTQTANEKMDCYWQALYGPAGTQESFKTQFLESEKAAAAHLEAYNYMASNATATMGSHVHFKFTSLASIARLYLLSPAAANPGLFIDSLQVVNNSVNFTTKARLDVEAKTITPTETSRVISLKFEPSIDMTNNSDDTKETYNYWDRDYPTQGYIMAYMMLAPINLDQPEVDNSILYMIARQPKYYTTATEYNTYYGLGEGDDGYLANDDALNALKQADKMKVYKDVTAYNAAKDPDISPKEFNDLPVDKKLIDPDRKVYKARLFKINFLAGHHHQWVPDLEPDQPIKFEEITIQEWAEGTGFTNEDGAGTEDW